MPASTGFFERHGRVAVYVPNLIGYARIAFASAAFAVAARHPTACVLLYFAGFVCDELDGRAARAFDQASTLGAVLDMLTDRLSTAGLLLLLCTRYQGWYLAFAALLCLDVCSHWLQMYSSLVAGDISHKQTHNHSGLVRFYYTRRLFMGFCCVCCEVAYLALYLLAWPSYRAWAPLRLPLPGVGGPLSCPLVLAVGLAALPGAAVKQAVNLAQVRAACQALILLDRERDAARAAKAA